VSADPAATRLAREQCERELAALGEGAPVVGRVRGLLRDDLSLSLPDAAKRVSMSPRTLKRRLAEQGTTFTELIDDARRQRALVLLEDRRLTLEAIAAELGYSDTANFSRAFRRWTGRPPGEARDRIT
jgi:AraC-like DNA-binding protein